MVHARSVSRLPDNQKFDHIALEAIDRVTYELHISKPREAPFRDVVPQAELAEAQIIDARDVYLKESDFEAYGYSDAHALNVHFTDAMVGTGLTPSPTHELAKIG